MLYVVLVTLIMSVITAETLEAILNKKLAPLNQKIEDVNLSMSLINEKYKHMLKKLSTFDEESTIDINFIQKENILYDKQFGFHAHYSTDHAMLRNSLDESEKKLLDFQLKKKLKVHFIDSY